MKAELFETVYLDDGEVADKGNIYDKPYYPGSGRVRHILGYYEPVIAMGDMTFRQSVIKVFFNSGEEGIACVDQEFPGPAHVYQFLPDPDDDD